MNRPLTRLARNVAIGSKCEILALSICFPLRPRNQTSLKAVVRPGSAKPRNVQNLVVTKERAARLYPLTSEEKIVRGFSYRGRNQKAEALRAVP